MAEPKPKRKRPHRKGVHASRREELEELNTELRELEKTFKELQQRAEAVHEDGDDAADDQQAKFLRRVLRSTVQRQQREAIPMLRLLSEFALFDVRSGSPIHEIIHLPRDPTERRELLMSLRKAITQRADSFLRTRYAWVDPSVLVRDHQSFEAPNGDFCLAHLCTYQFAGSATVRGVFDVVVQYFRNIEIVLSELGSVTIREDDQHGDGGASQNRLVALTSVPNLVIESNYAVFSSFDEENEPMNDGEDVVEDEQQQRRKKGYGVVVFDFIERDELYPYQPDRRARRDANVIFEVTGRTRSRRRGRRRISKGSGADEEIQQDNANDNHEEVDDGEEEEEEEDIVTVVHWVNMRLHRPAFPLPEGGWTELRQISERWVSSLRFALREIYVPTQGRVV